MAKQDESSKAPRIQSTNFRLPKTSSSGISPPKNRIRNGWLTSPAYRRSRVSYSWLWFWMCSRGSDHARKVHLMVKKIVGWSIHDSLERAGPIRVPFCPRQTKIVLDALEMARVSRRPGAGLLHHSDRGSQYASNAFQAALERLGAISSMSRKGNCWDNAMMERPKPEGAGVGSRRVFSLRSKTSWILRGQ